MTNINDLTKKKRERHKKRLELYNQILKKCHNKILIESDAYQNKEYILYTIPPVVVGYPLVNINECSVFLINKLVKNGFNVKYLGNGHIFIGWKNIAKKKKLRFKETPKIKASSESNFSKNPKQGYFRNVSDIPSSEKYFNFT